MYGVHVTKVAKSSFAFIQTSFKFDDGVIEKNIPAVKEFCEKADKTSEELGL